MTSSAWIRGAAGLLAASLAAGLWATARATPPAGFGDLAAQCAGYTRFFGAAILGVSERNSDLEGKALLIHLSNDGRLGVDVLDGESRRYAWSGGELTYHAWHLRWRDPVARYPGVAGAAIAQVWAECRAGFANSTWVSELPPKEDWLDRGPGWSWARLDLPFEWATTLDIYVSINKPTDPRLRSLVIIGDGWWRDLRFDHVDWNATYPDQVFSPLYPLVWPPVPDVWAPPPLEAAVPG